MGRIEREDLEKMFGRMVAEKKLSIMGFKKKMNFEIYDGLAYCPDFEGKEYMLKYPRMSFVKESPEIQEEIEKETSCSKDDITILDVIRTFTELYVDGDMVYYDKDKKEYVKKDTFEVDY